MNGSVSAVPGRRPARASTNVACASPGVSAAVAASRPAMPAAVVRSSNPTSSDVAPT